MIWRFECPEDGCDFAQQANEADPVIESAQQYTRDAHGDMPTREEVEPHVIGPG